MKGRGVLGLVTAGVIAMGCASMAVGVARFPVEHIEVPAAAQHYTTAARAEPAGGGIRASAERDIKQALVERGAKPEADRTLADTATWALSEVHQSRNVTPSNLEAAIRHFGFPGQGAGYAVFVPGQDTWRDVLDQLAKNLHINRYGLSFSPSAQSAALVMGTIEVSLEPIPRFFEPGSSVALKGQIGSRYDFGHVYFTKPDGTVDEKRLPGRGFDLSFALNEPGKYQLEVMGDGPTGPHIVSNVPLYVGVLEPPISSVSGQAMVDPKEAEQRLLTLLNEARRRAGAGPLLADQELRALALAHSQDMAEHDFVGHVSPSTGPPENRLRRSGILVAEFGENIARADTPEGAHDGLMNSPGHRSTLLKPYFTHVGIGVVEKKPGLIATFNFGRRVSPALLPTGTAQVEAAIAALRANKSLPAARIDTVYRAGAQAGAVEVAEGEEQAAVDGAIAAGMKREVDRIRQGRPAACTYVVDLLELAQLEQIPALSHPKLRSFGVGAKLRTDQRGSRLSTVIVYDGVPCG